MSTNQYASVNIELEETNVRLVATNMTGPDEIPKRLMDEYIIGAKTVSIPLRDTSFPLMVRAFRHAMPLGTHKRADGSEITPKRPSTWPAIARARGIVHSVMPNGREAPCNHRDETLPRGCLPQVDLGAGPVYDGASTWVLRKDGPPARKEDLTLVRQLERLVRGNGEKTEIAKLEAELGKRDAAREAAQDAE